MVTHTVTIPNWLDLLLALPLLTWRMLRYGYAFRKIPLTQGKFAIVDPEDYYELMKYKWHAHRARRTWYAMHQVTKGRCRYCCNLHMHRLVIKAPKNMIVDHINGNGLDNRKANLRLATQSQNRCNSPKRSGRATSKYKGVSWNKQLKAWKAQICFNRRVTTVGHFENEIDAARAYDAAAKKYHGEFASLNFPD